MNKTIYAAAATALASLFVPGGAHASDAIVVSSADEAAGDWGADVDRELAPLGSALGQDLVSASIAVDDEAGVANFIIEVTELPPSGGVPEASRYTWNIDLVTSDGSPLNHVELDGKFTNYSRGICDPTAGTCPPPRDPGMQPFFLRGNCETNTTLPSPAPQFTFCQEFATVMATFDATAATITIPVPISALAEAAGADCFEIAGGTNIFGGFMSAAPSAFLTSGAMPMDTMDPAFGPDGAVTAPVGAC